MGFILSCQFCFNKLGFMDFNLELYIKKLNYLLEIIKKNVFSKGIIPFIGLVILVSCGEKPATDDGISKTPELSVGCKINEDNLDHFFSREVPDDIDCLRANLEFFVKMVRPDNPSSVGKLSRAALERYIHDREPKLANILKYTPLFFSLSHLIFGDSLGYLSIDNIRPLSNAAIAINRELAIVYPILNEKPKDELYRIHKSKSELLIQSATRVSLALESLFKKASVNEKPLALLEAIDIFATNANQKTLEKIKSLTFLKRVFAGGDYITLTQVELRKFVGIIPQLTKLAFDLFRFETIVFEKESFRYKFFREVVDTLEESLYFQDRPSAALFQIGDLEKALLKFEKDIGIDGLKDYFGIIPELKTVFGVSTGDSFLRSDLDKFLSHIRELITLGEAFVDIYFAKNDKVSNQVILESHDQVVSSLILPNPKYSKQFKDFVRIARNYRFFRGDNPIPFYGDFYKRNLDGMIESILIEYVYGVYASYYEEKFPCDNKMYIRLRPFADPNKCTKNNDGQCIEDLRCKNGEDMNQTLSQGQVEYIIVKLNTVFDKLDLITKQLEYSSAETTMLMNDLFQYQSNSNSLIDKFEIAEFGGQIISAISMKTNIIKSIKEYCASSISQHQPTGLPIYQADCFRQNFIKVLYEKFERNGKNPGDIKIPFQYAEYLPRLIDYLEPPTSLVTFVHKMEEFTRTCYGYFTAPDQPNGQPKDDFLFEGDLVGVYGGLFNIESTLTRFDKDPVDNYLRGPEVDIAYEHFKGAVQGLLADVLADLPSKYQWIIDAIGPNVIAKKAFYYMLKYKELPGTEPASKAIKFVEFMLNNNYKDGIEVDRITMAAVLSGIKTSSKNKPSNELRKYICNRIPIPIKP